MISVEAALKIVLSTAIDFGIEVIPLSNGINRILKENWISDRDLPPYDRVTMDGIAIQFEAFQKGQRQFPIEGIAAAGDEQHTLKNSQSCLEVMTGSVLPANVDTVIRYEDITLSEGLATLNIDELRFQQNVHFKGEDRKAEALVLEKNKKLSPAEIGLGASIGKAKITVGRLPKIMVISTGDELVPINTQPQAHQIRRSNVYRLCTTLNALGIPTSNDHINDDPSEIRNKIGKYLNDYDAIILSGGVSKGKFDYLPQVLEELNVEKLFHKVAQRPGKPFWFGKKERPNKNHCTIFALPGNPVSSFLCMQRYFLSWLQKSMRGKVNPVEYSILGADVLFKPNLTYFLEVELSSNEKGALIALPKKGNGSGDLANLVSGDAFVQLPNGKNEYLAGEVYPVLRYR